MINQTIDVLCVGMATWDLTMQVNYHPEQDEKMFADAFKQCGGGPAANAAFTVAKLGGRSAFAGYLGKDPYGMQHLEEFNQIGVVTNGMVWGDKPTPLSVVLAKANGNRTVVCYRENTPVPCSTQIMKKILEHIPRVMLFDGHEKNLSVALAKYAKQHQIPVVLDAGSVHQGITDLLKYGDYLVTSFKFAQDYCSESDPGKALEKLGNLAKTVVITLGKQGLIWRNQNMVGDIPAFKVKVKDTTGAGDIFHGAFVSALSQGYPLKDILRFSSAAAALCCTKIGARTGCPSRKEVEKLLGKKDGL
jgi:sulfofructose kinase